MSLMVGVVVLFSGVTGCVVVGVASELGGDSLVGLELISWCGSFGELRSLSVGFVMMVTCGCLWGFFCLIVVCWLLGLQCLSLLFAFILDWYDAFSCFWVHLLSGLDGSCCWSCIIYRVVLEEVSVCICFTRCFGDCRSGLFPLVSEFL